MTEALVASPWRTLPSIDATGQRVILALMENDLTWEATRTGLETHLAASPLVSEASQREIARAIGGHFGEDAAIEARDLFATASSSTPYFARTLSDIRPEPVRWLWEGRIACGKLSIIAGQPGRGKSQLTLAMAATVTRGGAWPDGTKAPSGHVVMVACEDDAADTIRPRAEAAGARLDRIHMLEAVRDADGLHPLSLDRDVSAIERIIADLGSCALVIIDPVTAYLGRVDSRDAPQVRGVLQPLVDLAQRTGVAVVLVSHLNKGAEGRTATERITGSGAFVAVCRSAWLVEHDSEHSNDGDDRPMLMFAPLKNNIGDDRSGFRYVIESSAVHGITTSRVRWVGGAVRVSANKLLAKARQVSDDDTSALGEASAWLRDHLSAGPALARDVESSAKDAGIASRTLRRAADELGINKRKNASGGQWTWRLPSAATSEPAVASLPLLVDPVQGGQRGQIALVRQDGQHLK